MGSIADIIVGNVRSVLGAGCISFIPAMNEQYPCNGGHERQHNEGYQSWATRGIFSAVNCPYFRYVIRFGAHEINLTDRPPCQQVRNGFTVSTIEREYKGIRTWSLHNLEQIWASDRISCSTGTTQRWLATVSFDHGEQSWVRDVQRLRHRKGRISPEKLRFLWERAFEHVLHLDGDQPIIEKRVRSAWRDNLVTSDLRSEDRIGHGDISSLEWTVFYTGPRRVRH